MKGRAHMWKFIDKDHNILFMWFCTAIMSWNWLVYAAVFSVLPEYVFPTNVSTVEQSPDLLPCDNGWFYFGEKCYLVGVQMSSWAGAANRCIVAGGHLVTIESKEELDFIVAFLLLDVKSNVWIGLHDRVNESYYSWHDGSEVNYTNWNSIHSEPSGLKSKDEDCVEMFFQPEERNYGTWNDVICTTHIPYICQRKKKTTKISPDPTRCPSDNGYGWKLQDSCYHIVKEKKSWHEAEKHCGKHYNGGHLVTVLDVVVDNFLNYIMSDLKEEVWIGIDFKEQVQQQWASGWYVGYNALSEDNITYSERYCVARTKLEEWTLVECSKMLFFVCETSEMTPPVLVSPGPEHHCPDGIGKLRDLGGKYCYFIETKNYSDWSQANFECEKRGGNLASIHSKEENDILGPFIKYNPQYGVYIGLTRSLAQNMRFVWSDGSAMDFTHWSRREPNNVNERCGEIHTRSMEWNDVVCDQRKGFVCAVRKHASPTTSDTYYSDLPHTTEELETVQFHDTSTATTELETVEFSERAFPTNVPTVQQSPDLVPCEKGWFYFREKCYTVRGQKSSERCSWTVAADRCKGMGGHLVTIQSKEELDFIVSFMMLDVKTHVWIGLHDQANESQYTWHDGSNVNYTNWNFFEPSGVKKFREDCVEMFFRPENGHTGKWNDNLCTVNNGYICQTNAKNEKISPDPTRCPSDTGGGWKFQELCYHIVKEKKSWHDAEEHCGKHYNGGHLVTVLDVVVDNFLNYILSDLKEGVWIGVSIKEQFQQQWTSGWYVGYSDLPEYARMTWGYCIARNKLEGWSQTNCSKKFFFVCETSETAPTVLVSPGPEFHCPEGIAKLRDLGGEYCYFIETKQILSWYKANFECERRGGNLVAIHSKEENDILGPFIKYNPQYGVYIGLLRSFTLGEEFIWSDGSSMDFVNWGSNEPNNLDENCGEMHTRSIDWNDAHCDKAKGYICSVRKIGPSSFLNSGMHKNASQTANSETIDSSGQVFLNALIGVIICMVLLLIFLGVVIYYFRLWDVKRWKKLNPSPQPSPKPDKHRSQAEFLVKDDEVTFEYVNMQENPDTTIY